MKKYFKVGLRPVFYKQLNKESFVYVFNWETGDFFDDFRYYKKIFSGLYADETEEISKEEFDSYVKQLKKERGL